MCDTTGKYSLWRVIRRNTPIVVNGHVDDNPQTLVIIRILTNNKERMIVYMRGREFIEDEKKYMHMN